MYMYIYICIHVYTIFTYTTYIYIYIYIYISAQIYRIYTEIYLLYHRVVQTLKIDGI